MFRTLLNFFLAMVIDTPLAIVIIGMDHANRQMLAENPNYYYVSDPKGLVLLIIISFIIVFVGLMIRSLVHGDLFNKK